MDTVFAFLLSAVAGWVIGGVFAVMWYGADLLIGSASITPDRAAGLMLISAAVPPCILGAVFLWDLVVEPMMGRKRWNG